MLRMRYLAGVAILPLLAWSANAGQPGAAVSPLRAQLRAPSTDARLIAGRPVSLRVRLSRNGQIVIGTPGVFVTAVIAHPEEKGEDIVRLHDDGRFGDTKAGDGEWTAVFRDTETPGHYRLGLKVAERGGETRLPGIGAFTLTPIPAVVRSTTIRPRREPGIRPPPSRRTFPVWWMGAAGALGLIAGWLARRPQRSSLSPSAGSAASPVIPEPIRSTDQPLDFARDASAEAAVLRAECDRLRIEAEGAREQAVGDERRNLFQSMAPMLVQLPAVRKAVQDGADLRARDVLPLLSPLDTAVRQMGIEPIGAVGEVTSFEATLHQPAGQGQTLLPGQEVRIKFVGYRMGEAVLRRAQVERVAGAGAANPST